LMLIMPKKTMFQVSRADGSKRIHEHWHTTMVLSLVRSH